MPLRCKIFARLNNCANCDEADVSFVQTQKNAKSLISNFSADSAHAFPFYDVFCGQHHPQSVP